MKKIFLLALSSLIFAVSCSKDDGQGDGGDDNQPAVTLITPDVSVRIADPLSSNPFTGALEIYPCDEASSIYYGNYVNGKLTVFNGFYLIENGDVYGEYNRALHLPAGVYNMVYWGTPQSDEPTHNKPQIVTPGVSAGSDLSKLYFSLRSVGTDVYSPVYDLVHAVKSAHIGTDPLQTSLTLLSADCSQIMICFGLCSITQSSVHIPVGPAPIISTVSWGLISEMRAAQKPVAKISPTNRACSSLTRSGIRFNP